MRVTMFIFLAVLICQPGSAAQVRVTNPLSVDRRAEIISVPWDQLQGKTGGLTADNARVLDSNGAVLMSQAEDSDGDGVIDQLLFQADLGPTQTRQFEVVADAGKARPETEARVYARYVPERKDDFAWENDVVAFRAYGPALASGVENSGIDCFMKRVKYPVIDGWIKGEKLGKSYHVDYGEGYDGYKVGSSLGAGGSAVWYEDKLHLSNVYREYKQFSSGPLRASFTLSYGPWEVGGKVITEIKRITLDLGKRLFKVQESFMADGKPARLDVAVGVTTHDGDAVPYHQQDRGYLYAWENVDGQGFGTGVVIDPANVSDIKEYKVIDSKKKYEGNAFYVMDTGDDGKFTYYAGYGWEKAGEITTREQWEQYLQDWVVMQAEPVKVEVN